MMTCWAATLIVADGHGGIASQSFTWTVTATPLAPMIANPGSQSSVEGDTVSVQVYATSPNGSAVSYIDDGLPPGLGILGVTGVIGGHIDSGAAAGGPYLTTVWVTDGTNRVSQSFDWTVSRTTDAAPTLTSPGNQTNAEGDVVSVAVTASDPEVEKLSEQLLAKLDRP